MKYVFHLVLLNFWLMNKACSLTTGFEFPGFGTVGELSEMLPLGTAEWRTVVHWALCTIFSASCESKITSQKKSLKVLFQFLMVNIQRHTPHEQKLENYSPGLDCLCSSSTSVSGWRSREEERFLEAKVPGAWWSEECEEGGLDTHARVPPSSFSTSTAETAPLQAQGVFSF